MKHVAIALFVVSISAYVVSFVLPAYELLIAGKSDVHYGYDAFLVAFFALWHEMLGGPLVFLLWLANPAFWSAAVLWSRGRNGWALVASCAAILLSGWFLFGEQILIGYYVWFAAMPLLAGACVAQWLHGEPCVSSSLPTKPTPP